MVFYGLGDNNMYNNDKINTALWIDSWLAISVTLVAELHVFILEFHSRCGEHNRQYAYAVPNIIIL